MIIAEGLGARTPLPMSLGSFLFQGSQPGSFDFPGNPWLVEHGASGKSEFILPLHSCSRPVLVLHVLPTPLAQRRLATSFPSPHQAHSLWGRLHHRESVRRTASRPFPFSIVCDPVWPADAPGAMSSYSACRFAFLFWGLSFLKTQGGKLPCVLFGIRRHQNRFGFMWIVMWEQRGCWGVPSGSNGKESACNAGDPRLIPGSGKSSGEGNGYTLQYSGLGNSKDRGAWWATIHGVAKSQT